jgi:hypothetical protein
MSMVFIESRPAPINVSLHGMRHTAACHRNTSPQKQPYASRYAASHTHVFRCDDYQCLVFQVSTCRASICMTSFSDTSKKAPRQRLVVWDVHIQATTNRPPGTVLRRAIRCTTLALVVRISSWRIWDTLLTPPVRIVSSLQCAMHNELGRIDWNRICSPSGIASATARRFARDRW